MLNEYFLHYIWRFKKLPFQALKTSEGIPVEILKFGHYNQSHSGPDFKEAIIRLGQQTWAGHVEMHMKSSDWYAHNHQTDQAYDNVILHVVWTHDVAVFQKDQSRIPTLELEPIVAENMVDNYRKFIARPKRFIVCENSIADFNHLTVKFWLERLYFERLEKKSESVFKYIKQTKQHWDYICFIQLAKTFGLKLNGEAFEAIALSIEFKIIQKYQSSLENLEALLFGQANLLSLECEDAYYKNLQRNYKFLKQKYNLKPISFQVDFFRLRPHNFPTIRLAQLAALLHQNLSLADNLLKINAPNNLKDYFNIKVTDYWENHFTFGKLSKVSTKQLSKNFIELCAINAVAPLIFTYFKWHDKLDVEMQILPLISSLKPENNAVINAFLSLGLEKHIANAQDTQALLELKTNYCDQKRCLNCNFGIKILNR